MLKRRTLLAAAPASAALLAAPPRARAQGSAKTTLTVGMAAQDAGQLDPHRAVGTPDRVPVGWMFNGLVRFKPGTMNPATIEPDLAESWTASDDKKTWTFKLRKGVKFHGNYGELTADDVVFSLKRAADPKTSAFSTDFAAFEEVTAVDPQTVQIKLKNVVPSLLGLVTNYSGGYIVCKKAVEERGAGYTRAPIGTGPFAFVSVTPNQSLELIGNEAYFRGAPKLKKISYRYLPSNASRDLAFQSGEVDLSMGVQDQKWVDRMKGMPHTAVDVFEPGELGELNLNVTVKPLDDIRVRQAIAYAVNRPEVVAFKGKDVARAAQSVIPIGNLGFTADNGLPQHNLEKAKQLLKEAGYPDGLTIKIIMTQLPGMLATMQVVQAQLKRAGINLDMQIVEHATFHQMIRKDLSPIVYYEAARFPVADIYLTQFFDSHSIVMTPGAVTNFSHCAVADKEIEGARVETDPKKQLELWAEAQRKIIADVCAVPIAENLQVWARHTGFQYGFPLTGSLSLGPLVTEQSHFA